MPKELFGTDGIRGVAGEYPLDPRTAHVTGMALGQWARKAGGDDAQVLIGMDTRESGSWLAAQVAGGLRRERVGVRFAGVIPTPGLAWLTRHGPFVAGVMVSASHNPYHDNGIKVFGHSGYKLPDELEHDMEQRIFALLEDDGNAAAASELSEEPALREEYLDYLTGTLRVSLDGLRLVTDCAHGAAWELAPKLFARCGAAVTPMACAPNGRNINESCGALHLDGLHRRAVAEGAIGIAFDGDADRAMLIAPSGKLIDGDHVLLLAARHLQAEGRLDNGLVVATVMSNLGAERALNASGIRMIRTPVGDKYVLEEMLRSGAALGGEQSGHVIFRDYASTGDGMLTALRVLEIMRQSGRTLEELTADFEIYPQKLVNVRVQRRQPLAELPTVQEQIRAAEEEFGGAGRVLVRFSGTEPLARVMVEGHDARLVESWSQRIAAELQRQLA